MSGITITNNGEVDIALVVFQNEQWLRKQDVISWLAICAKDSDETGKAIFNTLIAKLANIQKQ